MREIRIVYNPHPKQRIFHESRARYRAFVGGVGSGKTWAGCNELIRQALEQPRGLFVALAPTYTMAYDIDWRTFFEICPGELISYINKSRLEIHLINGSQILFRSADRPERLRGLTIAGGWLDEAAYLDVSAWHIMQARLRQAGYMHKIWLTTTPKGKNWLYDEFCERDGPEYFLVHCSSRDNPYLPSGFIESLLESYSGIFAAQEIEGQFVGVENRVYREFSRDVHVRTIPSDKSFQEVLGAVDWGFTNPAVVLAVGVDSDGRLWVLDEFYQRRITPEEHRSRAAEMARRWGIERFFCDPSEPGNIESWNMHGLRSYPGNNALNPGLAEVSSLLPVREDGLPRLIISPTCIHLISEIEQYQMDKKGDKPLKCNDHACDALRYVAMAVAAPRPWVLI